MSCKNYNLFVVLGMHRSGTSLISKCLEVFGISHGNQLLDTNEYNEKGYWEDNDIVKLHDKLFHSFRMSWDDAHSIPVSFIETKQGKAFIKEAQNLVEQRLNENNNWCFKDPRTLRFLPFWFRVFEKSDIKPKFVFAIRNPLEVANSLMSRDFLLFEQSLSLWLTYIYDNFDMLKGENVCIIEYSNMLNHPEEQISRLAKYFNVSIDEKKLKEYHEDFLDKNLNHSNFDANQLEIDSKNHKLLSITNTIYKDLLAVANETINLRELFEHRVKYWPELINDANIVKQFVSLDNKRIMNKLELIYAQQKDRVDELQKIILEQQSVLTSKNDLINSLNFQIQEQQLNIDTLKKELMIIYNSKSWRLTFPLRCLFEKLRHIYRVA